MDVITYLENRGIEYRERGKNISSGWIGVNCPFCVDGDPSEHLGINLESASISCWRCPTTGTMIKFIMKTERISFNDALNVLQSFSNRELTLNTKKSIVRLNRTIDFDFYSYSKAQKTLRDIHRQYLIDRNLDPDEIIKKYRLSSFAQSGNYVNRIFVPVFYDKKMVSFTAKDHTGKAKESHINCPDNISLISIKDMLYNIDNAKRTVLVVEGPSDVWNIGDGSVGTMGTKYSTRQVQFLMKFDQVFIMFDAEFEAQEFAHLLAIEVAGGVSHVEIIKLDKGDPGEMSRDDVKHLRREIFGKVY